MKHYTLTTDAETVVIEADDGSERGEYRRDGTEWAARVSAIHRSGLSVIHAATGEALERPAEPEPADDPLPLDRIDARVKR